MPLKRYVAETRKISKSLKFTNVYFIKTTKINSFCSLILFQLKNGFNLRTDLRSSYSTHGLRL